ncbi:MAG: hypothetical protein ACFB10_18330 [Salibacteraceae bacterium]
MKQLCMLGALVLLLSTASCRKCYFCQLETPIVVSGDTVNTHIEEEEICGKDNREDLEFEGYTCRRKNQR